MIVIFALSDDRFTASNCGNCHERVIEKALSSKYQHSVVMERCPLCHINQTPKKEEEINLSYSQYKSRYVIPLKNLSKGRYQVEAVLRNEYGTSSSMTVPITLASLKTKERDIILPAVRDVKIKEIRDTGFINADILWRTDKPSISAIEYGKTSKYGQTISNRSMFLKEHTLAIPGLVKNDIYHFRIIGEDVFGNKSVSQDFVLDTTPSLKPAAEESIARTKPSIKSLTFYRTGDSKDILLDVAADAPSQLTVKIKEDMARQEPTMHGYGFIPQRPGMIDICIRCHPQDTSHPVGVKIKGPGYKFPKDLPTIEGGVLTCVTCHEPHGGNLKYMARKDFKMDICVDCHDVSFFE